MIAAPAAIVVVALAPFDGAGARERPAVSAPGDPIPRLQARDRPRGSGAHGRAGRSGSRGRVADAGRGRSRLPTERSRRRRLERGIRWRRSLAVGQAAGGSLVAAVQLPPEGEHFFTWDPVRWTAPNRGWRRHGTDRLVRTLLRVVRGYAAANPSAPRVAVGDLSRPGGGDFGARYGALGEFGAPDATLGHASHQNGLDVDIYYPRRDRSERGPSSVTDIDRKLSQDLVDRFVAAGAELAFVGPRTGLTGPRSVVQPLHRHDDHLHVRLRASL